MKSQREQELEQFIRDALAYMRYCAEEGMSANGQLLTLAHDIGGLYRDDRCFRPRVSGYAELTRPAHL